MKHFLLGAAAFIFLNACSNSTGTSTKSPFTSPPPVKQVAVTEMVFGKHISDPYRWMSKAAEKTDAALTSLAGYDALYQELLSQSFVGDTIKTLIRHGGKVFHLTKKEHDEVAKLYVNEGGRDRELINLLNFKLKSDDNAAIHNFSLSPQGKTLAFHIGQNGNEIGKMHFLDVQTVNSLIINYPMFGMSFLLIGLMKRIFICAQPLWPS